MGEDRNAALAISRLHIRQQALPAILSSQIGLEALHVRALGFERRDGRLHIARADAGGGDARAFRSQGSRKAKADTVGGAGDEGGLAGKIAESA